MDQKEIILFLIIVSITIAIFISAIIIFIIFYRTKMMSQINEKETMKSEHQKEILFTQIEIQNQTMQHIGREIHDNIGQKLTLASLYTQQLAFENKAPHINESIENISTIINQSLSELRELSKSLTDNAIDQNSFNTLIIKECNNIKKSKKCKVSYSTNNPNIDLPYQTKAILLRILQEFIQNSIKHADCKKIEIILNSNIYSIELIIKDDGKGFDVDKKFNGIGLLNMKKRTELIGGNFNLESIKNSGTNLTINLPI
jgi:signal transduction histidine kinase